MDLVFLQRYEKLLNVEVASGTDSFLGGIGYVEHRKIARVLLDFCEPKNVPVSRYNNLTEETNALVEAAYRFNNVLEYDVIDFYLDWNMGGMSKRKKKSLRGSIRHGSSVS